MVTVKRKNEEITEVEEEFCCTEADEKEQITIRLKCKKKRPNCWEVTIEEEKKISLSIMVEIIKQLFQSKLLKAEVLQIHLKGFDRTWIGLEKGENYLKTLTEFLQVSF